MNNILFIGTGNMASAIAGGIINSQLVPANYIYLYDKNPEQYLKFDQNCHTVHDIAIGVNSADYIFLSVKPQNIKDVLNILKNTGYKDKVFVSICAGITIETISSILTDAKIIRTMPNTPLMIGQGITALCKNQNVSTDEFEFVKSLFASSGYVTEIEEKDINSLTALTSSAPAYVYLFAKAMEEGAKKLCFNYDNTVELICRTLIGSANMILSSDKSIDDLITMVKSPNGTTERALNVFDENNFIDTVCKAMEACAKRAEELSKLN